MSLAKEIASRHRELQAQMKKENRSPREGLVLLEGEVDRLLGTKQESPFSGELIESVGENGFPQLAEKRVKPEELSLKELAEAFGILDLFDPSASTSQRQLLESYGGHGVDPTAFVNISAWDTSVSKQITARIMERYGMHDLIGRQMVRVMPTKKKTEKFIAVAGLHRDAGAEVRKPGRPHPEADLGERWMTTPETQEHALKMSVTQEAVFFDETNMVLEEAGAVGDALAFQEDLRIGQVVLGYVNNYTYKDTTYNTYLTSGAWINDQANPVDDETCLDNAMRLFTQMKDPETERRIPIDKKSLGIFFDSDNERKWDRIFNSVEVRDTTSTSIVTISPRSEDASLRPKRYLSPEWRDILVDDMGLSVANAREYWLIGNFQKAFVLTQNWALRTQSASPTESEMIDHGIARRYYANMRTRECVVDPRYVVRNKNA